MLGELRTNSDTDPASVPTESIFLLRKSSAGSTASVQVDFSPLSSPTDPGISSSRALPTFNQDRHHFTPSFILSMDEVLL